VNWNEASKHYLELLRLDKPVAWRGRVQLQRCSPERCGLPRVFEMSTAGVVVVLFTCDRLMFVESMCSDTVKYSPLPVGSGCCKIAVHAVSG